MGTEKTTPSELSDKDLDRVQGAGDPLAYPDLGGGDGGGKKVKAGSVKGDGDSSAGDEAGTSQGIVNSKSKGPSYSQTWSANVKVDGF